MQVKNLFRSLAIAFLALLAILTIIGILRRDRGGWTQYERGLIHRSDSLMNVTLMPKDSAILRSKAAELTPRMLRSRETKELVAKMLYTVRHPSQDGVGIAAPQVGISRRIICIQRFDLPGEPFVAFLNPQIDSLFGEVLPGPEGCLSVPGKRGIVRRNRSLILSYVDGETLDAHRDTIEGFTAVIVQHECDHLDGVLYTDRADSLWTVSD